MAAAQQIHIEKLDQNAPCLLCRTGGRVESHIIPQFVTRDLKRTGATGYIRDTMYPNVRRQGGPWDYLLCKDCESRFGRWEHQFANRIFRPVLARGQRGVVGYGPWLTLFATSLTWRALVYSREHPEIEHPTIPDWSVTDPVEEVWRECLLESRNHPGAFEQHLVLLDYVTEATTDVPSNLNTFITRSFDFRVMSNGKDIVIYSHLPNFMFFGLGNIREKPWQLSP